MQTIALGRPRGAETRRRTRHLLELVAAGEALRDAARTACVKPERVLSLLEEPEFRAALFALLDASERIAA